MASRLEAERLSFSYRRGGSKVVEDFSHTFHDGALTAITGPSGCGKSTLLYLLGLMLNPSSGTVLWEGRAASGSRDSERARIRAGGMGFVFQDAVLDPARTILDNASESGVFAGHTLESSRARARVLLERFGLAERADHRPGEISGGQAQRVALCRALLTGPTVIFGDEPTGNLDHASADAVWNALSDYARQGNTVVVVTHDRARAEQADVLLKLE